MTFIPHTPESRAQMLKAIGVETIEDLLDTVPAELRLERALAVPPAVGEVELAQALDRAAGENQRIAPNRVFAGGGLYPHHIPAVVDELSHRGEFYTAYTPYQAEVSQGMLQCIYEYQSYICMLTGMEVSNASGYDGGTVLADSTIMAYHAHRGKRERVLFASHVNPEARAVCETYGQGLGLEFTVVPECVEHGWTRRHILQSQLDENVACVVFQYPDFLGYVDDKLEEMIGWVHDAGALAIVSFYPFAAGLLKTPGELGADIVCGEGQCLGNPMGFGGPLLGFIATAGKLVRVMPGRIIGRTKCERGGEPGEGFVMTLQAREQHIRRDKAMSNICSNEALLALRSCIYLGAIGRQGFTQLANICHENACRARHELIAIDGVTDYYPERCFFNEFTLRFPEGKAEVIHFQALKRGMLAGIKPSSPHDPGLKNALTFAFTEMHHWEDIRELAAIVKEVLA